MWWMIESWTDDRLIKSTRLTLQICDPVHNWRSDSEESSNQSSFDRWYICHRISKDPKLLLYNSWFFHSSSINSILIVEDPLSIIWLMMKKRYSNLWDPSRATNDSFFIPEFDNIVIIDIIIELYWDLIDWSSSDRSIIN